MEIVTMDSLNFTLTESDYRALEDMAAEAGVNISEYVRQCLEAE